jgi:hypothetical protein
MTVRKTAGAYADCKAVMDLALNQPNMEIEFDTYAEAARFRQRCHSYRKRLYDAAIAPPGGLPSTPYDALMLCIPAKGEPGDNVLRFENREAHGLSILSRIRTAEGEPLELPEENPEEALAALRGKLGLE